MKIYLSHSRNFDFQNDLYNPIKVSSLATKYTFVYPHETSEASFPIRQQLDNQEIAVIIAEVSFPSTGQGIELGWASAVNVPIICLYKNGTKPSNSLHTVSAKLLMYTDTQNMIEDIEGALKNYA